MEYAGLGQQGEPVVCAYWTMCSVKGWMGGCTARHKLLSIKHHLMLVLGRCSKVREQMLTAGGECEWAVIADTSSWSMGIYSVVMGRLGSNVLFVTILRYPF